MKLDTATTTTQYQPTAPSRPKPARDDRSNVKLDALLPWLWLGLPGTRRLLLLDWFWWDWNKNYNRSGRAEQVGYYRFLPIPESRPEMGSTRTMSVSVCRSALQRKEKKRKITLENAFVISPKLFSWLIMVARATDSWDGSLFRLENASLVNPILEDVSHFRAYKINNLWICNHK